MLDTFIDLLLSLSLFYNLSQTRRQMLKEFRDDLQKEKSSQNPITVQTYENLREVDKVIIDRYSDYYRACDNAVYLAQKLNYSPEGIKWRIGIIANQLKRNTKRLCESVDVG